MHPRKNSPPRIRTFGPSPQRPKHFSLVTVTSVPARSFQRFGDGFAATARTGWASITQAAVHTDQDGDGDVSEDIVMGLRRRLVNS